MRKRLLKIALGIVVVFVLVVAGTLYDIDRSGIPHDPPGNIELRVEVTPEFLVGKPMADLPAQFGSVHSANITRDRRYTPLAAYARQLGAVSR